MIWHRIKGLASALLGARKRTDVGIAAAERCHDLRDDDTASDSMKENIPWDMLVRYGGGDTTPEELSALASWRGESDENASLLRRVSRLATLSRAADALNHTDAGWERLQHRLEHTASSEQDGSVRVLPVRRARFDARWQHGSKSWFESRSRAAIAAAAAVLVAAAVATWTLRPKAQVEMADVSTNRGERIEFALPDGSHVVLGAESRLRYAADGFATQRALYLEGQAYFAVAHDAKHPFVVHTRGASIQDVGTEFGVRAYREDSTVDVAVASGRALMHADSGKKPMQAMLEGGDLGQMDPHGALSVRRDANLDLYLGWVRSRLIYDMAPVSTVVHDLERWYDISIRVDSTARNEQLRVTMTIDPTQPAPVSLDRFAEVVNLRVVANGNSIQLVPRTATRKATSTHSP